MLRAFHPFDLLSLEGLLAEFVQHAPEYAGLPGALFAAPEKAQVWATVGGLDGFVYLPGEAIRRLEGLYARDPEGMAEMLEAAIATLQASGTLALMAPERFGDLLVGPSLERLGFQRIERIDMVQDQMRVPASPLGVPDGMRVIPWEASREAEAAALLAESNQGSLDGLFLCFPDPPGPAACRLRLEALRAGEFGPFLADVSAMVLEGERLVGVLLVTQSGPDEAFLYELSLSRDVQGRGLAPMLIRRIQDGARARGLGRIRFMWCDRNRAVRRLFPAETIGEETREPWWVWLSDSYRLLRRKRGSGRTG